MNKIFSIDYGNDFYFTFHIFGIKIKSHGLYNLFFGNPLKTNCSIFNLDELLKKNIRFFHPTGICIAPDVKIGENCIIHQNVTIGLGKDGCPTIGSNVRIFSGAVVIGKITIGDNAIIGANAVVTKDVAPNTVVGGVPAKFIRYIDDNKNSSENIENNC